MSDSTWGGSDPKQVKAQVPDHDASGRQGTGGGVHVLPVPLPPTLMSVPSTSFWELEEQMLCLFQPPGGSSGSHIQPHSILSLRSYGLTLPRDPEVIQRPQTSKELRKDGATFSPSHRTPFHLKKMRGLWP